MEPYLKGLGLPLPKVSIPYRIAYVLAAFTEIFNSKSNFNRFAVIQTCVDHTFVHNKATQDFGYEPIISEDEAFERTLKWFKEQEKNSL